MMQMVKGTLEKIIKGQKGQVLPIVLILLVLGGLLIVPTLNYASTSLKVGQMHEQKMAALYAADAGIEDAINKIVTDASLEDLEMGGTYDYPQENLPVINNLPLDSIAITKLALVYGILGEDEYKTGQPHSGWLQPEMPYEAARTDEYVEYQCNIIIDYDYENYNKNIWVTSVGAFFFPYPGDESLIVCPYDVVYSGVLASVAPTSIETKSVTGGWAVIWRWDKGVKFDKDHTNGELSFKFKILDPDWELGLYFAFLTTQSQDISYSASGEFCKWVIEAKAEDTIVKSCVLQEINGGLNILTWEINPPA